MHVGQVVGLLPAPAALELEKVPLLAMAWLLVPRLLAVDVDAPLVLAAIAPPAALALRAVAALLLAMLPLPRELASEAAAPLVLAPAAKCSSSWHWIIHTLQCYYCGAMIRPRAWLAEATKQACTSLISSQACIL